MLNGEAERCDIAGSSLSFYPFFQLNFEVKVTSQLIHPSFDTFIGVRDFHPCTPALGSTVAADVRRRRGHVKGNSGGGSRRVHSHTLGNTIGRSDITSME